VSWICNEIGGTLRSLESVFDLKSKFLKSLHTSKAKATVWTLKPFASAKRKHSGENCTSEMVSTVW